MNTLLDLLESDIKVEKFIPFVLGYIVFLWLMFSFWVLKDAHKRYEGNKFISAGFFLLVLPLNFPALVFYLIIRPETEDEIIGHNAFVEYHEGGINVPVVNFMGKDGLEMSFQLKIMRPESIAAVSNNKMKVDVSWASDDAKFELKKEEKATEKKNDGKEEEAKPNYFHIFGNKAKVILSTPKTISSSIYNKIKISRESAVVEATEKVEDEASKKKTLSEEKTEKIEKSTEDKPTKVVEAEK